MKSVLVVDGLHVYLGGSHVLQGVSFSVPEGGVTALLGRNGVGKTTTLRAILGLVPSQRRATSQARTSAASRRTGSCSAALGMSPRIGTSSPASRWRRTSGLAERNGAARYDLVYDLFPELRQRARQRAGTLSGGQQQMVAIAARC